MRFDGDDYLFAAAWERGVVAQALADGPQVVEIWPGTPPDEPGTIGAETTRMSPKSERKQVEVSEPTLLVTNVTKPTITIYRPAKEKDTGAAVLICPGRRLLEPVLAAGRRGSRGLAELDRRDGDHPQVPRAAAAR